jgi:hypothetical protein
VADPSREEEFRQALERVGPIQLCVGLVIALGEEIEKRGQVTLTSDEASIGSQFVEMVRHLRTLQT